MSYFREDDEQERKLFVGGFNKLTTDEDNLKTYFERYGNIIDCNILRDSDKRSRGFGFILFDDAETVDKIMRAKKSGSRFCVDDGDTNMEVKRALPKGSHEQQSTAHDRDRGSSRNGGSNKIFVGGLASSVTEDELRQYFDAFGRVNQVELLRDRETNRLRGFAFISFEEEDSADKCIQRRTHEICRKMCEVRRAHQKTNQNNDNNGGANRYSEGRYENQGRDNSRQNQPSSGGITGNIIGNNMGNDMNGLIQQAFLMGQQSVYQQLGLQPPAAAAMQLNIGMGGVTAPAAAKPIGQGPANNILLQALSQQQMPHAMPQLPMATPVTPATPAVSRNTSADTLSQLAQLLQSGGVDPSALGSLIKQQDTTQRARPAAVDQSSNNGYSTSYPGVYSQASTNYGSMKYEEPKRSFRPY